MLDKVIISSSIHLPVTGQERRWGLWVSRVGCNGVAPGRDHGMAREGRVLAEFAVVYITRGRGVFRSRSGRERGLRAGDLLLLFPGVGHYYRADPQTGWNEYWALFGGSWPTSLMRQGLFSPRRPVLRLGLDSALHRLLVRMLDMARARATGHRQEIAALLAQVLARALALARAQRERRHKRSPVVEQALCHLRENLARPVDLRALAASLHLSYPHFRRVFRELTGTSPYQYHLQMKIVRAKELLEAGNMQVKEVAAALGFEDPYYFARVFKRKTGVPPSCWQGM